jgi:hypothetical protein
MGYTKDYKVIPKVTRLYQRLQGYTKGYKVIPKERVME